MIAALAAGVSALIVSSIPAHQVHDQFVLIHFVPFERVRDLCRGHGPLVTGCTLYDAGGRPLGVILPTPSTWPGTDKAYRCEIEHEGNHFNGWSAAHEQPKACR